MNRYGSNSENKTYKPPIEKYRKNLGKFAEKQDHKVYKISKNQ